MKAFLATSFKGMRLWGIGASSDFIVVKKIALTYSLDCDRLNKKKVHSLCLKTFKI